MAFGIHQVGKGMCYLCGRSLVPMDEKDVTISTEHVVPKSILKLGGQRYPASSCPITLKVHAKCDNSMKAGMDEGLKQYHLLFSDNDKSTETFAVLKKIIDTSNMQQMSTGMWRVPGVDAIHHAVSRWVCGCHAILFKEYLPSEKVRHGVIGPLYHSGAKTEQRQMEQIGRQNFFWDALNEYCIPAAIAQGSMDSVVAWGDKVRFDLLWIESNTKISIIRGKRKALQRISHGKYRALWRLLVPGVLEIAQKAGRNCWWYGNYTVDVLPRNSVITNLEI